eukprot:scaffold22892_cov85-Phaeocystis_antarctica.AAC.2
MEGRRGAWSMERGLLLLLRPRNNTQSEYQTDVDFPNQTPTQTVSLIPTPRLYTKVRTSL